MKTRITTTMAFLSCLFFILSTPVFGEYVKFKDAEGEHPEDSGKQTIDNGGLFLGTALNFGQTLATEGDWVPKLAYDVSLEVGYTYPLSSWSLIAPSAEIFSGKASYRTSSDAKENIEIPIGAGLLLKIGYGYSLGSGIFGIWEAGVGPVNAKYSTKDKYDQKISSDGTIWGVAGQLGFLVTVPLSDHFSIASGVKLTHIALDVEEVNIDSNGTTTSKNLNKPVNINLPEVQLGIRYNF